MLVSPIGTAIVMRLLFCQLSIFSNSPLCSNRSREDRDCRASSNPLSRGRWQWYSSFAADNPQGHSNLCQLLLAFELLAVLQHGAQVVHALLHIVCYDLVQPEMSRVIELFEEVGHEVLQKFRPCC